MHICGMDFSLLASYWQIKALLMLAPSVVTPQNQYFPANAEKMSVHCLELGCIGNYTPLGPRCYSSYPVWGADFVKSSVMRKIFRRGAVRGFYAMGWAEWFLMASVHGWRTYSNVF